MHHHSLLRLFRRLFGHCAVVLALCAMLSPPADARGLFFRPHVQKQVVVVNQSPAFAFVDPSFGFQFAAPLPVYATPTYSVPSTTTQTITTFDRFGRVLSVRQFNQ